VGTEWPTVLITGHGWRGHFARSPRATKPLRSLALAEWLRKRGNKGVVVWSWRMAQALTQNAIFRTAYAALLVPERPAPAKTRPVAQG